jgi:hypothetical protein
MSMSNVQNSKARSFTAVASSGIATVIGFDHPRRTNSFTQTSVFVEATIDGVRDGGASCGNGWENKGVVVHVLDPETPGGDTTIV